jgi:hypothetical protein
MKDNLIADLEGLFHELVDYRSRLLHYLNNTDTVEELDEDTICDLRNIRSSLSYVEDRITEIKDRINKRVYCVQVTSNVDMTIKVLAKNEDDALEWACQVADNRIRKTLGREHDCDYYSTGDVIGDESINDDEADEEYEYDE